MHVSVAHCESARIVGRPPLVVVGCILLSEAPKRRWSVGTIDFRPKWWRRRCTVLLYSAGVISQTHISAAFCRRRSQQTPSPVGGGIIITVNNLQVIALRLLVNKLLFIRKHGCRLSEKKKHCNDWHQTTINANIRIFISWCLKYSVKNN